MARTREFNKEDVLDQAIQLFSVRGYEATSIRDLIDITGISSSSLYEVFGDKRGIFLAALARFCKFERSRITQMAAESGTPQRFIEHLFASLEEVALPAVSTASTTTASTAFPSAPDSRIQRSLAFNTMVEFGTLDPQVTPLLLDHYFGIAEIIADVLSVARTSGTITTQDDPHELAYTILSTLQGLATVKGIQPTFGYRAAITRMMLKLLDQ
jgi:TetR/AcrR family transcriptional repressor of nem operon